jgi:aminopeptidase
MLNESHLQRYAEVLLWGLKTARRQRFQKNDIVMIRFHIDAIRLAEILYNRILRMDMNPILQIIPTAIMEKDLFEWASDPQLKFWPPGEDNLHQRLNGAIFLYAPTSITHLADVDPRKIALQSLARKPLRDVLDRRDAAGGIGWTLCILPTSEQAKHAKMDLSTYSKQIINACRLNRKDPVAQWCEIYDNAQEIKKWLNSLPVRQFHLESAHIDLKIVPGAKRRWVGLSGHNIPSFELFTSPDCRETEGVYFANLPSYRSGNLVSDVRLVFEKGSANIIEASQGENFAKKQLSMDCGANKIGEFSLTDKRFSKIDRFMANTLFDENFGGPFGNCHIALGSSYADTYSGNPASLTQKKKRHLGFNDSALHWDLVNTEPKRIVALLPNGRKETIYENGLFKM